MADGTCCTARRVHPLSSDYYVRCEHEAGHAGDHINDGEEWNDNSPYSLPRQTTASSRYFCPECGAAIFPHSGPVSEGEES